MQVLGLGEETNLVVKSKKRPDNISIYFENNKC